MIPAPPILAGVAIAILLANRRDFFSALRLSFFFLLLFPQSFGIRFGEDLPILSVSRLIIITLTVLWLRAPRTEGRLKGLPFAGILLFLLAANSVSLVLSVHFVPAFKAYLSVLLENILLFAIIATSVRDRASVISLARTALLALSIVSALGILERYTGFHPLSIFPSFEPFDLLPVVYGTYPHPIHFGIAMAVGALLAIFFLGRQTTILRRLLMFALLLSFSLSLYFSLARGPWLALGMGLLVTMAFSPWRQRRWTILFLALLAVILLLRPGIQDTLVSLATATFDSESLEGKSFSYRFQIAEVALREIEVSPDRFLFGFGLKYHRNADIEGIILSRSWDNEHAILLLETGVLGLACFLSLFTGFIVRTFRNLKGAPPQDRDFLVLALSVCTMFLFMMTNVAMFSSSNLFLYYGLAAMGTRRASDDPDRQ